MLSKSRISYREVELAYRKLKSYIYHDNFSLPIRIDLAEYESEDVEKKLRSLHDEFNRKDLDAILSNDIKKIDYRLFPKKYKNIEESYSKGRGFYYSNQSLKQKYQIDRVNPFINCSINIHIFTVLWLMKIGVELDASLIDNCIGNRLVKNEEGKYESSRIKLFYPYYNRYNSWRDEAIQKAKDIHKLGNDTAILNLDIKDYYHSVDFNLNPSTFKPFPKTLNHLWMNIILDKIHKKYRNLLKRDRVITENVNKKYLPIGLLSSQVLANYYMKDFDDSILNNLKPIYYGRYVDDILIVYCNPKNSKKTTSGFIENNLCSTSIWQNSSCKLTKYGRSNFNIYINKNILTFQISKVKLYHFSPKESINLLDEFANEIKKNSSEFRFQPEDEEIFNSFESSSFKITYSDTINKLRSIEAFNSNKLGASTHLSKLIKLGMLINNYPKNLLESTNSILRAYFQGQRGLELSQLWEKLYTFYVMNDAEKELIECARDQLDAILRIRYVRNKREDEVLSEKIQNSLYEILAYSFAMAASLNGSFFSERILTEIKEKRSTNLPSVIIRYLTIDLLTEYGKYLIESNLLRHYYINFPLINYCNQSEGYSFISKKLHPKTSFNFDSKKIKFSPRFIHYHEVALFYKLKLWRSESHDLGKDYHKNETDYLLSEYLRLNRLNFRSSSYKNNYPQMINGDKKEISISLTNTLTKIKIGIVNDRIDFSNSIKSMSNRPNLSLERYLNMNRILNSAIRTKCKVLSFPEISIPFQWIPAMCKFSKENDIAVICGIEHFSKSRRAYNYVCTILPFTHKFYKNCYPDFRLKKDYAPDEINEIKKLSFIIPKSEMKREKLRLFNWCNCYFTVLNCFEISDITKRAQFRGDIDFMVTIEYNKDVPYFSNITESLSRDIHSYVIQVNTSQFGDSRITQPASTAIKDILKLKGGEDSLLITGIIDIHKLRAFQELSLMGQKEFENEKGIFKQTPANYKKSPARII